MSAGVRLQRAFQQEELWNGNRETIRQSFLVRIPYCYG